MVWNNLALNWNKWTFAFILRIVNTCVTILLIDTKNPTKFTKLSKHEVYLIWKKMNLKLASRHRSGHGFTTACAISTYHHQSCEFKSHSWRVVLDTLCDKVVIDLRLDCGFLNWNIVESGIKHNNPNPTLASQIIKTITYV